MRMRKIVLGGVAAVAVLAGLALGSLHYSETVQDALFQYILDARATTPHDELYDKDSLDLVFCGTGSPTPDRDRASACIGIFAGGKLFLLDTGPGGWVNLSLWQIPVGGITGVLFTHYHSDHIGGLGDIALNTWAAGRIKPLALYGPPGVERIAQGFEMAYSLDAGYRTEHHGEDYMPSAAAHFEPHVVNVKTHDETVPVYDDGALKIVAFRVSHEPVDQAYGYRVDYKGRSVIFSGDTHKDENLARVGKGVDVMVHEAINVKMVEAITQTLDTHGDARRGHIMADTPTYHTTPVEAAELANEAGAKLLVFSHLVPSPPANAITDRMFMRGVDKVRGDGVVMGFDGLHLELPVGSKDIRFHDLR